MNLGNKYRLSLYSQHSGLGGQVLVIFFSTWNRVQSGWAAPVQFVSWSHTMNTNKRVSLHGSSRPLMQTPSLYLGETAGRLSNPLYEPARYIGCEDHVVHIWVSLGFMTHNMAGSQNIVWMIGKEVRVMKNSVVEHLWMNTPLELSLLSDERASEGE